MKDSAVFTILAMAAPIFLAIIMFGTLQIKDSLAHTQLTAQKTLK